MAVKVTKKPVARTAKAASQETRLRTVAAASGLRLEKQGRGWQLVDAKTGTQVAADWAGDAGLSLDQIEVALKG